ncbi:MAG: acetyltransferase [Chthoniobacteraceae bacterium]
MQVTESDLSALERVGVVLFGVGSGIVVDFEESLARAGLSVSAAVRNFPGEVFLQDANPLVEVAAVTDVMKAQPYLVPLFTPANRQKAAREAEGMGFSRAYILVDSTVVQPKALTLGAGVFINAGCVLGSASEFGEFVLVNRGACLGHHVRLQRFVSIGPGVVLAGGVSAGIGAMIGAGAVVLPNVSIGANAVVGAGSVVTRDVPDHCMVLGNPARVVKRDIPGHANQSVE